MSNVHETGHLDDLFDDIRSGLVELSGKGLPIGTMQEGYFYLQDALKDLRQSIVNLDEDSARESLVRTAMLALKILTDDPADL